MCVTCGHWLPHQCTALSMCTTRLDAWRNLTLQDCIERCMKDDMQLWSNGPLVPLQLCCQSTHKPDG
uniref:Uncharacterized protein n=1 Tax=Ascaris lumbricoides TaxID=6252 RepID=A0A0M3I1Y1_ASCLU